MDIFFKTYLEETIIFITVPTCCITYLPKIFYESLNIIISS
jgi:hypothetical protein